MRRTCFLLAPKRLLVVLLLAPSFLLLAAAKKSPGPAAAPAPAPSTTAGKESALSALFRSTPEASTTMRLLEALNMIPSEDEEDDGVVVVECADQGTGAKRMCGRGGGGVGVEPTTTTTTTTATPSSADSVIIFSPTNAAWARAVKRGDLLCSTFNKKGKQQKRNASAP